MKYLSILIILGLIFVGPFTSCEATLSPTDSSMIGGNNMENDLKQASTNTQESQYNSIKSGVFFIGGEYNGTQYINQSMVHRLGFENAHTPIVMLPGLGLSAYIYTSTPDGRNGWTADFAQAGFDTYAIDTSNLAISGLEIALFGTENQPRLSTWGENKIWRTWGFGEKPNEPYAVTQYPVEYIEQLYASFSPQISRVTGTRGSAADLTEVANIISLLEKTGSAVLMVHSMGGVTGVEVVKQRPDLVKALVVIEPVGSPVDEELLREKFVKIPFLAVYGDFIESRGQTGRHEASKKTARILNEIGGVGEVITMTDLGVNGNTHLMMQDKNSSDISNLIIEWLNKYLR